jgi:hypothetical protein
MGSGNLLKDDFNTESSLNINNFEESGQNEIILQDKEYQESLDNQ